MGTDASGSISLAKFQVVCAHLSLTVTSDELDAFLHIDLFHEGVAIIPRGVRFDA